MNHRYAHVLTPVRVGNLVLKNRLINSKSIPEGLQCQDPAGYMTEQTISFAANLARNGASIVTCSPGMFRVFKGRTFFTSPWDMEDRNIQANFRRMIERFISTEPPPMPLPCATFQTMFPSPPCLTDPLSPRSSPPVRNLPLIWMGTCPRRSQRHRFGSSSTNSPCVLSGSRSLALI